MRGIGTVSVIGVTLAVIAGSSFAAAVSDAAGGFSYAAPLGWKVGHLPQARYTVAYGKPSGAFAPNIVVVDEQARMSLAEYARANLTQMQQRYPGFHSLGQSAFVTGRGLHGLKLVSVAAPIGRKIRQVFYLFSAKGDRKIVVTVSTPAEQGSQYDGVVNAAMKTFVLK